MSTGTTPRIIDNRYILDEDWREGGMARVYRAFDRKEHRTVAVKILARELNPDERFVNHVFDRERRSLERLRHDNIVELLDGGRDPLTGEPYFVFEWIDRNLGQWLEAVPSGGWEDFATRFGFPILEALAHAQERQVQHRDIKPANILVTEDGVPKIRTSASPRFRLTSSREQPSPITSLGRMCRRAGRRVLRVMSTPMQCSSSPHWPGSIRSASSTRMTDTQR